MNSNLSVNNIQVLKLIKQNEVKILIIIQITSNYFDLYVTGTFYHQNPRFNSLENKINILQIIIINQLKKNWITNVNLCNELNDSPFNNFLIMIL